jgi:hypothetical protein
MASTPLTAFFLLSYLHLNCTKILFKIEHLPVAAFLKTKLFLTNTAVELPTNTAVPRTGISVVGRLA